MTDLRRELVATFPDGSVLNRYIRFGEYWHESSETMKISAQRLTMRHAAVRVVYQGGEVVPGVAAATRFYAMVARVMAEREAEAAARRG